MLNEDYKDILRSLSRNKVKFLVVGAYALGMHGYPRATGDFDIWVEASKENSVRIFNALRDFGAPLKQIADSTFSKKGIVFQIGIPPRRIDIINHIDGVSFSKAYPRKKMVNLEGIRIPFISLKDLIKNKQSTGRMKDKVDVAYLKEKKK